MSVLGVCEDCGRLTARSLPAHIPHICEDCLFPITALGERDLHPVDTAWTEMLEMLHRAVARSSPDLWRGDRRRHR